MVTVAYCWGRSDESLNLYDYRALVNSFQLDSKLG